MHTLKKTTAVLTALLIFTLSFAFALTANAKTSLKTPCSLQDGLDALRAQFERDAVGQMDYNYFVPCNENKDDHKYPLVVICCGIGEGYEEDQPINRHAFVNWSSVELQRRFTDGGGYVMLPRSPQDNGNFWYPSTVPMLKACLDDFVKKHNVDTSRIYIAGFSIGARMVYQMVDAYPDYFAAAVIMSPYTNASAAETKVLGNLPVWFQGSSQDLIVNYGATYKGVFDEIIKNQKDPAHCRFTTFTYTVDPDGKKIWNNHETWHAFSCDMFYKNDKTGEWDQPWPYTSTVDGNGRAVEVSYPNGMISWLNTCEKEDASSSQTNRVTTSFLAKMLSFFRRIIQRIAGLFSR